MNVYRALRRGTIFKTIVGREPFYWVKQRKEIVEFGSKYGRWAIDSSKVSESSVIGSFGLGEDVTFEMALIERFGCSVVGFDPTPRSVQFISETISNPRFRSFPYALSDHDGLLQFILPPDSVADQVSASAHAKYGAGQGKAIDVPCKSLDSIKTAFDIPRIDILKMDIEGAEFSVVDQAVTKGWLGDVSQLMVEFHHFLPSLQANQTRRAIEQLLSVGFEISWVGRTNHEYLFVRP